MRVSQGPLWQGGLVFQVIETLIIPNCAKMASANPTCHFANLLTDQYPPRYRICDGEFMAIEECQDKDENGYSESYLILLRSGHLNQYDQSKTVIYVFHDDSLLCFCMNKR